MQRRITRPCLPPPTDASCRSPDETLLTASLPHDGESALVRLEAIRALRAAVLAPGVGMPAVAALAMRVLRLAAQVACARDLRLDGCLCCVREA